MHLPDERCQEFLAFRSRQVGPAEEPRELAAFGVIQDSVRQTREDPLQDFTSGLAGEGDGQHAIRRAPAQQREIAVGKLKRFPGSRGCANHQTGRGGKLCGGHDSSC